MDGVKLGLGVVAALAVAGGARRRMGGSGAMEYQIERGDKVRYRYRDTGEVGVVEKVSHFPGGVVDVFVRWPNEVDAVENIEDLERTETALGRKLKGPWQGEPDFGSAAYDDDEPQAQLILAQQRRVVPRGQQRRQVARRRPQLPALSDALLHRLIVSGGDPLAGSTLAQAAKVDPRLVDALINQTIAAGMAQVLGRGRGGELPIQRDLYLLAMETMRQAGEGEITAQILASNRQENTDFVLNASVRRWPSHMKRAVRDGWNIIQASFADAKRMALQAARATRNTDDNVAWRDYADELDHELAELDRALSPQLGGPVAGRRRLPPGRRLLPGD
jgi:hypothetical protein